MILSHRQSFGVSTYHAMRHGRAAREHQRGLVLRVRIRFEQWLEGREVDADAFVDPGSDGTILSWRWAALESKRCRPRTSLRVAGEFIEEDVFASIGSRTLRLPQTDVGPRILSQPGAMPGYEDILLGRDFLTAHHLLVVIDAESRDFSLLVPDDEDNRNRREQIRSALRMSSP